MPVSVPRSVWDIPLGTCFTGDINDLSGGVWIRFPEKVMLFKGSICTKDQIYSLEQEQYPDLEVKDFVEVDVEIELGKKYPCRNLLRGT